LAKSTPPLKGSAQCDRAFGGGLVCGGDRLGRSIACFSCWMLRLATLDYTY
jgi:hypothetical protein